MVVTINHVLQAAQPMMGRARKGRDGEFESFFGVNVIVVTVAWNLCDWLARRHQVAPHALGFAFSEDLCNHKSSNSAYWQQCESCYIPQEGVGCIACSGVEEQQLGMFFLFYFNTVGKAECTVSTDTTC